MEAQDSLWIAVGVGGGLILQDTKFWIVRKTSACNHKLKQALADRKLRRQRLEQVRKLNNALLDAEAQLLPFGFIPDSAITFGTYHQRKKSYTVPGSGERLHLIAALDDDGELYPLQAGIHVDDNTVDPRATRSDLYSTPQLVHWIVQQTTPADAK